MSVGAHVGPANSEGRRLAAATPSSLVPPGFIPRGVNFILGGLAG